MDEVSAMNTNVQKLELVRYVFSTCILINLFGQRVIDISKKKQTSYSRLCLDNIQECISRSDAICDAEIVKRLIMSASGCDHSEVSLSLQETAHNIHKQQERIDNLTKVFKGAKERLPARKYEKIFKPMDDVEDPNIQEEFNFN